MLSRPRTDFWQVGIVPVRIEDIDACSLAAARDRIIWLPEAGRWRYLADPFGLVRGDALHVFVEAYDYRVKRAHIERQHPAPLQPFRHFTVDDPLRQPFNNGRFTYAGFTNQHRVVFGTALQNLNSTANFFITADHRIQLALLGTLGEIDGKFLQCLTLVFGTLIVHAFPSAHLFNRLSHVGGCCSGGF